MKKKIFLLIINKKKIFFEKKIFFIKIKNSYLGILEIYYGHIPIITFLKNTYIKIYYKNNKKDIFITRGFLECIYDKINILIF